MKCRLCEYDAGTGHVNKIMTHLHDVHGITRKNGCFQEYIANYFISPKCACGQCNQATSLHSRRSEYNLFADQCLNLNRFRNSSLPEFYLFRGYSIDDTISSISERASKIAMKSVTPEHSIKLSKLNIGDGNPMSYKSTIERTGNLRSAVQKAFSSKSSGSNNGFYNKTHTEETLERIAISRMHKPCVLTSPELIVYGILVGLRKQFDFQVAIGKYLVDFTIGNKVIEVNGAAYHSRQHIRDKDAAKVAFLKASGYDVLTIWDNEVIGDRQTLLDVIISYVD